MVTQFAPTPGVPLQDKIKSHKPMPIILHECQRQSTLPQVLIIPPKAMNFARQL